MMTKNMMKKTAVAALVGAMSYGAVGVAGVSASPMSVPQQSAAYTSFGERSDVQQLAWGGKRKHRGGKSYSQGSMTTAAIAGAVVGAIIAKNT